MRFVIVLLNEYMMMMMMMNNMLQNFIGSDDTGLLFQLRVAGY